MAEKSKMFWIGLGCAVFLGAGLILIAVVAFFGIQIARTMADPEMRHDKALEYLEAGTLPEGYETTIAMKVPFLAEVVILEGDATQFVYLGNLRSDADLAAAFADDESFDREIRRAGLKIGRRQTLLARDALLLGQVEVSYILLDGAVDFDVSRNNNINFDFGEMAAEEDEVDAEVSAVILLRCSPNDKPGLGLWAGPRANIDTEDAKIEQAAFRAFVEQFGFCTG